MNCSVVRSTWGFGRVSVDRLEPRSAFYIAGYTLKKLLKMGQVEGRVPEFQRMSLGTRGVGGIGAAAMGPVASAMKPWLSATQGVPTVLRYGKSDVKGLGRYLRRKLAQQVYPSFSKEELSAALGQVDNTLALQVVRRYAEENSKSTLDVFKEINQPYADQIAASVLARGALRETF